MIDAARRDDLKQIEAIQIASWQSAYRGLGSEAFLGEEVPDIMARKWARLPGPGWIALVARQGDRATGSTDSRRSKSAMRADHMSITCMSTPEAEATAMAAL